MNRQRATLTVRMSWSSNWNTYLWADLNRSNGSEDALESASGLSEFDSTRIFSSSFMNPVSKFLATIFMPKLPSKCDGDWLPIFTVIMYLTPCNINNKHKIPNFMINCLTKNTWMKTIVVVVMKRIANQVSMLEVLDYLLVCIMIFVGVLNAIKPTRIRIECWRWLISQLWHVTSISIHVVVTNHDSQCIAHVTAVTVDCFRMVTLW